MRSVQWVFCCAAALAGLQAQPDAGRRLFEASCAACHGLDGTGGERAPGIRRSRTPQAIRDVLRAGIPEAGMPPFHLPQAEEDQLVAYTASLVTPAAESSPAGDATAGERFFRGTGGCSACHMVRGSGGVTGPDLSNLARERTLGQILLALRQPSPMPGFQPAAIELRGGTSLRGVIRNQTNYDLQVLDEAGRLHLLTRDQVLRVRKLPSPMPALQASETDTRNLIAYLCRRTEAAPATPARFDAREPAYAAGDWPTYNGQWGGNRYSALEQLRAENVSRLAPRWMFPIPNARRLEVTPVVIAGVMYVTTANEAFALDARTGRQIWHYRRPLTKGVIGDAAGAINRGVAVLGDRVFLVTDNCHLLALNRTTGGLIWDVEMADYRQHYGATAAPLVVGDLVVSGTSGGDEGARGFISAYKAGTGERVWRFWTMPAPGEPLADTWRGRAIEHGCATAWLTGSYDAGHNLLYWATGNPCPDYNGDERQGDNLYANSVVALDPATGKLRWHYQFTPHDLHDWDAEEPLLAVDAPFHGRRRELLLQANRNGFFYVLDRLSGELLLARPFVKKLTWATGIGKDGRPQVVPDAEPTFSGSKTCPSVEGATNWMSSAYSPQTGLFYVMALERCQLYSKSSAWWTPGKSFYGGGTREIPGERGQKVLRAVNIQTGETAWEYSQEGPANSWGGVLATAGSLVFLCDDSGAFVAMDAKSGKPLWHFQTNQFWKASPMTYMAAGKQYVAVAAGSVILSFALAD